MSSQPAMLRLDLQLATVVGGQSFADRRAVSFGMRDFKRDGQRLAINGRTVFLRGRLDCANYPLTGYPPMDKAGWLRVLSSLKEWGLNHVRFHSWCAPEAAFEAADELGMYFQVELPNKRSAFKAPESTVAAKRNIDYLDLPGADPSAIEVARPKEPITINLNVKIEHEIRARVEKDLDELLKEQPGIF